MKAVINGEVEGDPRVQQTHPGPTQPDAGTIFVFLFTDARQFTDHAESELSFPLSVIHMLARLSVRPRQNCL